MLASIYHRGPDERDVIQDSNAVLGHVRLSIVGKRLGKQPVTSPGYNLVYNGEIYNYKDLGENMSASNYSEDSDTRVLFEALKKYEMNALKKLNGMFSFCFTTPRHIYLVRDRFGEKPLYYTIIKNRLYFASEIKAFASLRKLELKLPSLYAALETPTGKQTVFKDIYQVNPGSYIKINKKSKGLSVHRYYSFDTKTHAGSFKEQTSELRALVDDAIGIRTPQNMPFGVYISGGIDSSIIAMSSDPAALFTYLPRNSNIPSEEKYADIIASSKPGAAYIKTSADSTPLLHRLVEIIQANDGPTTTLAACSQYMLSKSAKSQGVRVVVGGMGADEFLNGYARHAIGHLPMETLGKYITSQYGSLVKKINGEQNADVKIKYTHLIDRDIRQNLALGRKVNKIFDFYNDPLRAMSVCDAMFTLPPLIATDDRVNMAFSVESRNPFLDYRVVDFALSLPPDSKIKTHGGQQPVLKHILKEAYKDILPSEIYQRKDKVGFSSNLNDLLYGSIKWQSVFQSSLMLLQEEYPEEPYYMASYDRHGDFQRWRYQILQLAITHLVFCKKISAEDAIGHLMNQPTPSTMV